MSPDGRTWSVASAPSGLAGPFDAAAVDSALHIVGYLPETAHSTPGYVRGRPGFTLSVARQGAGEGSVESSPQGISCGTTCNAAFEVGAQVTLTATPDAASSFAGWSGPCAGTSSCLVTMDGAKTVTATFEPKRFEVKVSRKGKGTVTSTPSGIRCPTDCAEIFNHGASVSLKAKPKRGWRFVKWTGGCSGKNCALQVTGDRSVKAVFARRS